MNGLSVTILVVTFCVLIAGLFAVIVDRTNERDEAREERDRLERECDAHAAENARLTAERDTFVGDKGTRLQLVPPQRDGSEHEWPRIARVLDIEAGEQG